jgi:subtilisin family serine protease
MIFFIQSLVLFSFLVVCKNVGNMQRIDYDMESQNEVFKSQSVMREESAYLIIIKRDKLRPLTDSRLSHVLTLSKERIVSDYCALARSETNERLIILTVYCQSHLFEDATKPEDVPELKNTLEYLVPVFGRNRIIVEKDNAYTTPKQFIREVDHMMTKENKKFTSSYRVDRTSKVTANNPPKIQQQSVQTSNVPWHLDRSDQRLPNYDGLYHYIDDASNINAYTLDTGVLESHVEFEGRATLAYNALNDGQNYDCNGHGTHVAGLIGAKTYGVAKKVNIIAIKVLDCQGYGKLSILLNAGEFLISHAQSHNASRRGVINLSLGGPPSAALDMMIQSFVEAGLVVVVAAGNDAASPDLSPDACNYSPSRLGANNYILSVGASDMNDKRAYYSNYGPCVTNMAPGDYILSCWIGNNADTYIDSGTSMASPITTGATALILGQNPSLSVQEVNDIIVHQTTPNIILPLNPDSGSSDLLFTYIDLSTPLAPVSLPPTRFNTNSASVHYNMPIVWLLVLEVFLLFILQ